MVGGPAIIDHPSPNFGPRRDGLRPELIVIHHTAMRTAQAALDRLCDPAFEVSAHYLVGADGRIWRLVDEEMRAWHAGAGEWAGRGDVNSRSIGIEIDNSGGADGHPPYSEAAMAALEALLPGIMARWGIAPEGVIGHADFAPARKFDPGPKFDWRRLARVGLSVWPEGAGGGAPARLFDDLATFGYPRPGEIGGADEILRAFRDRFRPGATGPADETDAGLAAILARRWPARG